MVNVTLAELIDALEQLRDTIGVDPDAIVMVDSGQRGRGPGLSELMDVCPQTRRGEVWLS